MRHEPKEEHSEMYDSSSDDGESFFPPLYDDDNNEYEDIVKNELMVTKKFTVDSRCQFCDRNYNHEEHCFLFLRELELEQFFEQMNLDINDPKYSEYIEAAIDQPLYPLYMFGFCEENFR